MPHLKPYLNHFSSGYAICSVAGILLQQIFHIKAAAGALMLAAVSFTALYFVKKERRAPMRQEQYYLAKRCTMSAVLGILLLAVVFALSYAYAHGIDQARQWAKVIAEMWWLAVLLLLLLLLVYALTYFGAAIFAFGYLAKTEAKKIAQK
ncbi:ABZJ_00895 family protein [Kingella kingae]|uniref:ABZJ_00895 family protein n=1 Tax=Kingella kingae TaxID=504 RepID=UPI002550E955|nr:ABZJ_00895 family protein [Kingella kingae]MDK4569216.1 ABZJ_00895 family protein [Kingella kingae]MDK4571362.1 ABZJ_00895 family protein [Kingella kingae]MDK4573155.1 ABZJ_00895 family protein [Kingella kingae]MDK4599232.1 ABZJ_00895 family protein [Kingella kingae]MDK4617226.1 ABZJ_00895 family protein [Kingella kingae]